MIQEPMYSRTYDLTDYDDIAEAYRIILDVSSSFFFLSSSMLNIMMKWSNL